MIDLKKLFFIEVAGIIGLLILIIHVLTTHELLFIHALSLESDAFRIGNQYLGYCSILSFLVSYLTLNAIGDFFAIFKSKQQWILYAFTLIGIFFLAISLFMFYQSYDFALYGYLGVATSLMEIGGEILMLSEIVALADRNIIKSLNNLFRVISIFFIGLGLAFIFLFLIK